MKSSLKVKLVISYILISLFLVFSLFFTARMMLNQQFETYVRDNQVIKSQEIVNQVIEAYTLEGNPPKDDVFERIGEAALDQGFILRVEKSGDVIWCMDCMDPVQCDDMLMGMKANMSRIDPNFTGGYTEESYNIQKGNQSFGTIHLGYYGPFYYTNTDLHFLTILNRFFITSAGIALLIAIALGLYMANRIASPLNKVIAQTGRIEQGHYQELIEFSSNTSEVDQLINRINSLASTLNKQLHSRRRLAQDYAHEFRTPLATLKSNLEAMIDGIWEPNKERLESLNEEVLRLTRMISGIDALVEVEDDQIMLNKSTFDLLEFTRKLMLNFESSVLEKNLNFTLEGSSYELSADKDKIGQVIVNLIANAIKYSNLDDEIKITIINKGNVVEFAVHDTGIGIDEKDLPYIYDHLYRADQSRASTTGGSGVGLAIVKAIVIAHQGEIQVSSEPGKGSLFVIKLPAT